MPRLLQFDIILLLTVCIRFGDIAIGAAQARDAIRAILYGFVALLALIALVLSFF